MKFSQDEILELSALCFGGVVYFEERGIIFFVLPNLPVPPGCTPESVDALLCPTERDGYPSRLFFSERVTSRVARNWNALSIRIGERLWHAFSWKIPLGLRPAQMIAAHLEALR